MEYHRRALQSFRSQQTLNLFNAKGNSVNFGEEQNPCEDSKPRPIPRCYETERWGAPPFFRPVRLPSDPVENVDGVSLEEIIAGEFLEAVIATYLFDMAFMFETVPRLKSVPLLIV